MALGITGYDMGMALYIANQMYQATVPHFRTVHNPLRYMLNEANQYYKAHVRQPVQHMRDDLASRVIDVENLLRKREPAYIPIDVNYAYR